MYLPLYTQSETVLILFKGPLAKNSGSLSDLIQTVTPTSHKDTNLGTFIPVQNKDP